MKKKLAGKKTTARKPAARKAAPKKAAAKPAAKPARPAMPQAKIAVVKPESQPETHKPGVHPPSKPAPAYAQMIQRLWARKPPPHKLAK